MKKIYHLSTCSTCSRILKEISIDESFELQDIKSNKITEEQLLEMRALSGSYEALFSRKAIKYRTMKLGDKNLSEIDIKKLILEDYTFLKRPVSLINKEIFIGNSKNNIESLKLTLKA
ncbi:MAG: hypothetical protein HRT72_00235 [Flavobacteriales bacterium]|nr:hypothetical protein [Flavobacteriales bacterium]